MPVPGELYYDAFKSGNQFKTLKQLQEFLRICAILPPDELTAQHYGDIKADLERVGSRIPENDLRIAAIAREHEMPLVTRDQHFSFASSEVNGSSWNATANQRC